MDYGALFDYHIHIYIYIYIYIYKQVKRSKQISLPWQQVSLLLFKSTKFFYKYSFNKFHFDVNHKTTFSFSYLCYKNCYPPHTKNSIALSLAWRIVWMAIDNTNYRLQELKVHLLKRNTRKNNRLLLHKIIRNMRTMTKMLLSSIELTIPIINFLSTSWEIALNTLQIENFKKHLMIKITSYYTTAKEIKKFVSANKIWN